MKKNDKRKIRIWKKTFALALSSVMIFSCIPMTQVKAGDESPEAIINGLVDLPKTFIDKDSQDLGSDRVFTVILIQISPCFRRNVIKKHYNLTL